MLVLSRKTGEQVLIPEHGIVITVLEARHGRARLGIKAPSDVKIIRQELQGPSRPLARTVAAKV